MTLFERAPDSTAGKHSQLLVAHFGGLGAGGTVRVGRDEAAVVTHHGVVTAVFSTGDHPIPPTVGRLVFVSLAPVAGIATAGNLSLREHGHVLSVPFQGSCSLACDDPRKMLGRLLADDATLGSGIASLLRAALGAVSEIAQKLIDKHEIRSQDLSRHEVAAAVLDRAVVPGRAALAAYGCSFLGFQRGGFGDQERAPESGRPALAPADFAATPYPTSGPLPEPPSEPNLPHRRVDFRETPYPLSMRFAQQRDQRVAAAPASDGVASVRRVHVYMPSGQWLAGRLVRTEGDRCEVAIDGLTEHAWVEASRVR